MQLDDLTKTLEDTAYVAIGFGVLAFQKAQVRRRDLAKQLSDLAGERGELRVGLAKLSRDIEGRIDPVVDELQERLPAQAREAVATARKAAKDLTEDLRTRLETAAA